LATGRSQIYVSRGGDKLAFALEYFGVDPSERLAIDLGSNVGGFVDCLLRHGASRVWSVDTSYGTLDWGLRNDPRVSVHERTNALHFEPEQRPVDLITIDVGWTGQRRVLPRAIDWVRSGGCILSLVKPQYEAQRSELQKGKVRPEFLETVLQRVQEGVCDLGFPQFGWVESPLGGGKRNREFWLYLTPRTIG
jgi:23S rRNA (cytidine1920-2'-O)/16S rRNA (cytidine1409-2'-O)-methyltransferase